MFKNIDKTSRAPFIAINHLVILIFIIAFLIRIAMNIIFQGINAPPDPHMGVDQAEYDQLAQNIVRGNGYVLNADLNIPNTFRPPGTPFLMALSYFIFGIKHAVVRIFFCAISAGTCIVTYFIGSRLGGRKLGILAALMLAVYPMHFYYSMHFFSEVPWALFISLGALSAILLQESGAAIYSVLLGFFIGFSAYIRPASLLYLPIFILLALAYRVITDKKSLVLFCIIPMIVFLLTILPWTIRNYAVTHHFVPIATQGGITLLGANNETVLNDPKLTGYWTSHSKEEDELRNSEHNPYIKDRKAYKIALTFITTHLKDMPRLEMMKAHRLVTPFFNTPNRLFNLVGGISWGLLMPFCILGVLITFFNRSFISLHSAVLLTLLIALIYYGDHRFREAISPLLVVYGCAGFLGILHRFKLLINKIA